MKHRIVAACVAVSLVVSAAPAQQREPYRSPPGAAARSMVVPGWGQLSNGDSNKALGFFALGAAGLLLASRTVGIASTPRRVEAERGLGWALYGLSVTLSSIEAYNRASTLNRENGYDLSRLRVLDDGRSLALGIVLFDHSFGGP